MLKHRSGSLYEDMYWIDMDSCSIIAKETNSISVKKIIYGKSTIKAIKQYDNILTIHTHPDSFPPSIDDINSNFLRNYKIGIVIGHDGKIFIYSSNEYINKTYYEMVIAKYSNQYYNDYEAQCLVLNELTKKFNMNYKEVTE